MGEAATFDFEWDPRKALSNLQKHRVSFDEEATVFMDALALTVYDTARSQGEERWFTLGFDTSGRLLAVAHTYEDIGPGRARVRIISAREATKRERRYYEEEPR
ncbi:MAG: BrnT family toxin [Xanthobacteraceae bacterium]